MAKSSRSDRERLRLFCDRVQMLVDRRGLRDGTIRSHFRFQGSATSTAFTFDMGDKDDLVSVLTAFRFFTADSEDTHFPAICNLLERALADPELRDANRANRAAWKAAEQEQVLIQVDGLNLTGRGCYDLWMNAEVFHADEAKERLLQGLPEFMRQMIRTQATSFVMDAARVLHAQRNVAEAHLRATGG